MANASTSGKKPSGSAQSRKPAETKTKSTARKPAASRAAAPAAKKPAARKPAEKAAPRPPQDPVAYRGLKAFLLLALAIFSLIGCFTSEGWFIWFFRRFMQGLIGKGFFLLPAALAFCAVLLAAVRAKPLEGRIACTLLLPAAAGSLIHLFGCTAVFEWSWKLPGQLYDAGTLPGSAGSGGVIGGFFAVCFESLFNKVGAAIVLLLAAAFLLLAAFDITIVSVVERSRERARQRAQDWEALRAEEAERLAQQRAAGEAPLPRHPVTASSEPLSRRKPVIDLPVDDGPAPVPPKKAAKAEAPPPPAAPEKPMAQPVEKPAEPPAEKPAPKEKDWLAEILTKDRLRAAAEKPKPEPLPGLRTAEVRTRDLRPVETAIHPSGSAAQPVTPVTPVSPAPPPAPKSVDDDLFAAAAAAAPPIPAAAAAPAAPPTSQPPKQAPTEAVLKEATAALAEEKAAKAVEKAETIKAKAEMVAVIEETLATTTQPVQYQYPPLKLLAPGTPAAGDAGREEMAVNAKRLSATIKSFGIPAEICDVTRGPTVTRYEVELEQGVKLNRLTNLADDIALALGVSGVRIAPIPNKISIVGIEVPNKATTTVNLRDVLDTPAFRDKPSKIAFAVGKDIAGNPVVGDIEKLVHLLIAGTTGSGKSVCMNSLILSLLYKATPEEVRLIMVDPKMIELGIYNGIPHLLIPVVTDPKKAAGALQWAVMEMLKRYNMMHDSGARDLASYNRLMEQTEGGQKLPKIVILIDELADLMMAAAKDVEDSICRIAQMGRAGGIHLVIATQRPSADVITGLMKANISSRIAFAVDSALNSRIILDATGAEKLVGKGDMLYAPIGAGKPVRVQGTFVTDSERENIINFVKEQGLAKYDKDIQNEIERSLDKDARKEKDSGGDPDEDGGDGGADELFNDAVDVVLDSKQASVSMLQRRLKLGYSRAARIVDQMEERGVVGPFEGSKPRAVLITREQWNQMLGISDPPVPPASLEEDLGGDDEA